MKQKGPDFKKLMTFKKEGKTIEPLQVFMPEDKTIVGVYQGSFSKYDILIKYRQKNKDGNWTHIRTPKHIHWAVDLLIKMHADREKIERFLDFLMEIWNQTTPFKNEEDRKNFLDIKNLLDIYKDKIQGYKNISRFGEYKIEFLILLAKLLMAQEKTNMPDAYMFRKLLEALKKGEDIFSIVSLATHRGK